MATDVTLTRKQIEQLYNTIKKDSNIDCVTVRVTHETGIGPTVRIVYEKVKDITDVENW